MADPATTILLAPRVTLPGTPAGMNQPDWENNLSSRKSILMTIMVVILVFIVLIVSTIFASRILKARHALRVERDAERLRQPGRRRYDTFRLQDLPSCTTPGLADAAPRGRAPPTAWDNVPPPPYEEAADLEPRRPLPAARLAMHTQSSSHHGAYHADVSNVQEVADEDSTIAVGPSSCGREAVGIRNSGVVFKG